MSINDALCDRNFNVFAFLPKKKNKRKIIMEYKEYCCECGGRLVVVANKQGVQSIVCERCAMHFEDEENNHYKVIRKKADSWKEREDKRTIYRF